MGGGREEGFRTHVQTLAVCTSMSDLLAVSGAACTQRVLRSVSCFTSVTSKETGEDLYFNSEEHLQILEQSKAKAQMPEHPQSPEQCWGGAALI